MTCELCGKENASVRIRQIIGSESREMRICESCARDKGIIGADHGPDEGVAWLLKGLFDHASGKGSAVRTCPSCGSRLRDIRASRRTGCSGCYTAFAREIRKILKIQGTNKNHRGKLPGRVLSYKTFFIDRENLKSRLVEALDNEEYEKAAELRDRIRGIDENSAGAE